MLALRHLDLAAGKPSSGAPVPGRLRRRWSLVVMLAPADFTCSSAEFLATGSGCCSTPCSPSAEGDSSVLRTLIEPRGLPLRPGHWISPVTLSLSVRAVQLSSDHPQPRCSSERVLAAQRPRRLRRASPLRSAADRHRPWRLPNGGRAPHRARARRGHGSEAGDIHERPVPAAVPPPGAARWRPAGASNTICPSAPRCAGAFEHAPPARPRRSIRSAINQAKRLQFAHHRRRLRPPRPGQTRRSSVAAPASTWNPGPAVTGSRAQRRGHLSPGKQPAVGTQQHPRGAQKSPGRARLFRIVVELAHRLHDLERLGAAQIHVARRGSAPS